MTEETAVTEHETDWAKVGALSGATVSVAANVAHALIRPAAAAADWRPDGGAVLGAVWWPLALFLALEVLISERWGAGKRWLAVRVATVAPVAAVAAVVSYHHLSGLLDHWSEDDFTVTYGPVAVDGLMILCSAALYRRRQLARDDAAEAGRAEAGRAEDEPVEEPAPADPWTAYSVPVSPPPPPGDIPAEATRDTRGDTTPATTAAGDIPGDRRHDTTGDIPPEATSAEATMSPPDVASPPADVAPDMSHDTGDTGPSDPAALGPDLDPVDWLLAERREGRWHTGAAVGRAHGRDDPAGARWGQRIAKLADADPRNTPAGLHAVK